MMLKYDSCGCATSGFELNFALGFKSQYLTRSIKRWNCLTFYFSLFIIPVLSFSTRLFFFSSFSYPLMNSSVLCANYVTGKLLVDFLAHWNLGPQTFEPLNAAQQFGF